MAQEMNDTAETIRPKRGSGLAQEPEHARDLKVKQQLLEIAELLFFAYRDFISDPDAILDDIGFGRAHHRVLHFVYRHPGLRVADLLEILKITKQSLARVLKQLVDEEYIEQREGTEDRRERLLFLTNKGTELTERLMDPQLHRITRALGVIGPEGEDAVRDFLYTMIGDNERMRVSRLLKARSVDSNDGEQNE